MQSDIAKSGRSFLCAWTELSAIIQPINHLILHFVWVTYLIQSIHKYMCATHFFLQIKFHCLSKTRMIQFSGNTSTKLYFSGLFFIIWHGRVRELVNCLNVACRIILLSVLDGSLPLVSTDSFTGKNSFSVLWRIKRFSESV